MPDKPPISPSSWDSKVVLGGAVIALYFVIIFIVLIDPTAIPAERLALVREMLAVIGPLIGVVGLAVWRHSKADTIRAAADAEAIRANSQPERPIRAQTDPWEDQQ